MRTYFQVARDVGAGKELNAGRKVDGQDGEKVLHLPFREDVGWTPILF